MLSPGLSGPDGSHRHLAGCFSHGRQCRAGDPTSIGSWVEDYGGSTGDDDITTIEDIELFVSWQLRCAFGVFGGVVGVGGFPVVFGVV